MHLIDTHTHIDLFADPKAIETEYNEMSTLTLSMSYIPEIFDKNYKNRTFLKYVRLALGYHPSMVLNYQFNKDVFNKNFPNTNYIGEVGLDYQVSKNDKILKKQFEAFQYICRKSCNSKILSIHSRRAEADVLEVLKKAKARHAIIHWYSGPLTLIDEFLSLGYFFSINTSMLESVKGKKIINRIPLDYLLIESDGPFTKYKGAKFTPNLLPQIYEQFGKFYGVRNFKEIIYENFVRLLKNREKQSLNDQKVIDIKEYSSVMKSGEI